MLTTTIINLSESIKHWHQQVENGYKFEIENQSILNATLIARNYKISSETDVLLHLCALNLLNAAIKIPAYKNSLSYATIKTNAANLVSSIDGLKTNAISYFYNKIERCLYFQIGDIVFSFHEVPLTPKILKASLAKEISWEGMRLQEIAQPIYREVLNASETALNFISTSVSLPKDDNQLTHIPVIGSDNVHNNRNKTEMSEITQAIREAYESIPTLPGWYRSLEDLYIQTKENLKTVCPAFGREQFVNGLRELGANINEEYMDKLTGRKLPAIKLTVSQEQSSLSNQDKAEIANIVVRVANSNTISSDAQGWYEMPPFAMLLKKYGLRKEKYGNLKLLALLELALGDSLETDVEGSKARIRINLKHLATQNQQISSPVISTKEEKDSENLLFQNLPEIFEGFSVGDAIEITSYGLSFSGEIINFFPQFFVLRQNGGKEVRIKYDAVLTITSDSKSEAILNINSINSLLRESMQQLGIDLGLPIFTNATITMVDNKRVWLTTDAGESLYCFKGNIIGYDKEKIIRGQRVFSQANTKDVAYLLINEMSYQDLLDLFYNMSTTLTVSTFKHKRTACLSILSYLARQYNETKIYSDLKVLKRNLKRLLSQPQNLTALALADDTEVSAEMDGEMVDDQILHSVAIISPNPDNASGNERENDCLLSEGNAIMDSEKNGIQNEEQVHVEKPEVTENTYHTAPVSLSGPRVIGRINLPETNRTPKLEKNNINSQYLISLIDETKDGLLPANGTIISLWQNYGWISPDDGLPEKLYLPIQEIVQLPDVLESPQPGDRVRYSVGKNKVGPIAICVHKQCSRQVLESIVEKISSYDRRNANILRERLEESAENEEEPQAADTLHEYLGKIGIAADKLFSPDEVEIKFSQNLPPLQYKNAMSALIKMVIKSNSTKSYNLFLRASSIARKNGMYDWAKEILTLAIRTFSKEQGKVGYFRGILRTIQDIGNRISITKESLSASILSNEDEFGEFPAYVREALLSYQEFNGITIDAETSRSGLYKEEYIEDINRAISENPTDDLMYLTRIKLELSFHTEKYNPAADIRQFLMNRAFKKISLGESSGFGEARYLLRLAFQGYKFEGKDTISFGLYLMTLGDYSGADIDMYVKGFRNNFKLDDLLRNAVKIASNDGDLELAMLAASNKNIDERIRRAYRDAKREPFILNNYGSIIRDLNNNFSMFLTNPIRNFHSFSGFLKTYNITIGKEREVTHSDSPKLVSQVTEFMTCENYRDLRAAYDEIMRLIREISAKLLSSTTMIGYEFVLPALRQLEENVKMEFASCECRVDPELVIDIIDEATKVAGETYEINLAIKSRRESARDIVIKRLKISGADLKDANEIDIDKKVTSGNEVSVPLTITLKPGIAEEGIAEAEMEIFYDDMFHASGNIEHLTRSLIKKISLRKESFKEIVNKYKGPSGGAEMEGSDDMFYGRDNILSELERLIHESWNSQIAIYGQKRSGKSSLINVLISKLKTQPNFACVKCSLQSFKDTCSSNGEQSLAKWLLRKLAEEIGRQNKHLRPYLGAKDHMQFFNASDDPFEAFEKFLLHIRNIPDLKNLHIVVFIDEFTYLYQSIKDGKTDNNFMRRWKALVETPGIRLQSVVIAQDTLPLFMKESYAANAFGIFNPMLLTYLSKEESRQLMTDPIKELKYHSGCEDIIYHYTSGSPLFTQIFCSRMVDHLNRKGSSYVITRQEIEEVLRSLCSGIERLEDKSFECLYVEPDGSDYLPENNQAILKAIAVNTRAGGSCKPEAIESGLSLEQTVDILSNLCSRRVLSLDKNGGYSINVQLYKRWLLNQ